MKHLTAQHFDELFASCIGSGIINLNFESLSGNNAYERLLYGLDRTARKNTGVLKSEFLRRYRHLEEGGWWCNGIDLTTFKETPWGCFKPDRPIRNNNKTIKYETPPKVQAELFALQPDTETIANILAKYPDYVCDKKRSFWQWVIDFPIPVIITEGAKKAAALLSQGYVAIALPGITMGYRNDERGNPHLIPQLLPLCKIPREFIFAFDQDKKFATRLDCFAAMKKTVGLLLQENSSCWVSVMHWEFEQGKGIDDLIAYKGVGELATIYEERLEWEDYEEKHGQVKKLSEDKFLAFLQRNLKGRLAYNELTYRVELDGKPIDLTGDLRFRFIEEFRVKVSDKNLVDGLMYEAKKNSYHPVRKYLESCHLLKPANIDDLACRYLGIDRNNPLADFYNTCVKKWLIAAVARIFDPGCKVDYALILQGNKQGRGKSMFFKTLGGQWFDDSFGANIESTKGLMVLHKSWIQEWAEFDRIASKNEFNTIKAFITRQSDCFVPPYGRDALDHPRSCILAGTVNKAEFLRDETGDRRFLVVPIPNDWKIPIADLKKETHNIWAAAVQEYLREQKAETPPWVISDEEYERLNESNSAFRLVDEWEYKIESYIRDRQFVTTTEILDTVFDLELGKHDRPVQMRVCSIMTKLGWAKTKNARNLSDGSRQRVWFHPSLNEADLELDTTSSQKVVSDAKDLQARVSGDSKNNGKKVVSEVVSGQNPRTATSSETLTQPTQPSEPNFQKNIISENYQDVIDSIDSEMARLHWTEKEGKNHLQKYYGKHSRMLLTDEELLEFRAELRKMEVNGNGKSKG